MVVHKYFIQSIYYLGGILKYILSIVMYIELMHSCTCTQNNKEESKQKKNPNVNTKSLKSNSNYINPKKK